MPLSGNEYVVREELGDVPMQPVFHARIRRQAPLRPPPQGQPAPSVHPGRVRLVRVRHDGYLKSLYHRHVMKCGGYRS